MKNVLLLLCILASVAVGQGTEPSDNSLRAAIEKNEFAWSTSARAISLTNTANHRGIIAASCDVQVTGDTFSLVTQTSPTKYSTELAGVSVTIGGQAALVRAVTPDALFVVAPKLRLKDELAQMRWVQVDGFPKRISWQPVKITTPLGIWNTWVAVGEVSPGVFESEGRVSGLARLGNGPVTVIGYQPVYPGSRITLLATGFRAAKFATVFITGENDETVFVAAGIFPWSDSFPWLENIAFDLPSFITGPVRVIVLADNEWSNEVSFTIER